MGHAALAEVGLSGPQKHGETKVTGILHGLQQHTQIANGRFSLAKAHTTCLGQFGHFSQRFAIQTRGQGAQRVHLGQVQLACLELQHFNQAGLVQHGFCVGWAHQRGNAASHGCFHFTFKGGAVFIAWFAQAGGQIHQARQHPQPGGINGFAGRKVGWHFTLRRYRHHATSGHSHIHDCIGANAGINHSSARNQDSHCLSS